MKQLIGTTYKGRNNLNSELTEGLRAFQNRSHKAAATDQDSEACKKILLDRFDIVLELALEVQHLAQKLSEEIDAIGWLKERILEFARDEAELDPKSRTNKKALCQ